MASSGSGLELSGIHPLDMGEVSRSHPCISPAPKTWPHNPSSTYFSQFLQPVAKKGWYCDLLPVCFSPFPHPLFLWCASKAVFSLQSFISCVHLESHSQLLLVSPLIKLILRPAFLFSQLPHLEAWIWGSLLEFKAIELPTLKWGKITPLNWQLSSCLLPFLPCALITRHVVSCSISFQAGTSQRATEKEVLTQLNLDNSPSLALGPSRLEREAHTHTVA